MVEAAKLGREGRIAGPAAFIVEWIGAGSGAAMIVLALLANHDWLDRHLLPQMFMPRGRQVLIWSAERGVAILLGLILIFPARQGIARAVRAGRGVDLALSVLLLVIAATLALLASEMVLRTADWERLERWAAEEEPLRRADPILGWINVPDRVGFETFAGRAIRYDVDQEGRRVANVSRKLDPTRASILFAGESILFGFRLNWNETAAAQIGASRGLQTVNLSVNGYGADQEWQRVRRTLPHFTRTKAVIVLFAPMMIERSLDRHRPRLDAALRWHAAEPGWRLGKLLRKLLLYHSAARVEAGVAITRANLAAIVRAARVRGAQPLILVPEFGPEQPIERQLREKVLAGLPFVRVELDPAWVIPGDGHPDARANAAMRRAILAALDSTVRP